jgi:hypothetical protein
MSTVLAQKSVTTVYYCRLLFRELSKTREKGENPVELQFKHFKTSLGVSHHSIYGDESFYLIVGSLPLPRLGFRGKSVRLVGSRDSVRMPRVPFPSQAENARKFLES